MTWFKDDGSSLKHAANVHVRIPKSVVKESGLVTKDRSKICSLLAESLNVRSVVLTSCGAGTQRSSSTIKIQRQDRNLLHEDFSTEDREVSDLHVCEFAECAHKKTPLL